MSAVSNRSRDPSGCTIQSSVHRCNRAVLAAVLVVLASVGHAQAHGEAEWIMAVEPRCCGPNDCAPVAEGGIKRVDGGFFVLETGEVVSEREALWSVDDHYWRCRYTSGVRTGQTRCLFVPALGF
jgi:hypothetical protein